jgi:hypothetical protein
MNCEHDYPEHACLKCHIKRDRIESIDVALKQLNNEYFFSKTENVTFDSLRKILTSIKDHKTCL